MIKNNSILVKTLRNHTDFSKCLTLKNVNRKITQSHVNDLIESFTQDGTAATNVIIIETTAFTGKKQHFIADGQHSIIAANTIGLPLNGKIVRLVEDTTFNVARYIARLNNCKRGWSNKVFLNAFNNDDVKVREYVLFDTIKIEHDLTTTDLLNIFLGGAGQKENKLYKSGNMTFSDEKDGLSMLATIVKLRGVLPKLAHIRRAIYPILRECKTYDRFANAILKSGVKFKENETEFYNQLVDIYNSEYSSKHLCATV